MNSLCHGGYLPGEVSEMTEASALTRFAENQTTAAALVSHRHITTVATVEFHGQCRGPWKGKESSVTQGRKRQFLSRLETAALTSAPVHRDRVPPIP